MRVVRRVLHTVGTSIRRLRRQAGASALLVTGLVAPVAVSVAVPAYSDAAGGRLFEQQVIELGPDASGSDRLAALFSFNRLSGGARSWDEIAELDEILLDPTGVPLASADRFVETVPLVAFAGDDRIGPLAFSSVTRAEDDVALVDGRLATVADRPDSIEVVVEATLAEQSDLGVGQRLDLLLDDVTFGVVVVGVWTDPVPRDTGVAVSATRPAAPFGDADAFRRRLLVPHETIVDVVSPQLAEGIQNVRWRLGLDPDGFDGDDVATLLTRLDRLGATAERLVPGVRELLSPAGALERFRSDQRALRDGLGSFSAPLLVLSLAVGAMLSSISLRNRVAEFRSLRRRGASRRSLVFAQVPDAIVTSAIATALGAVVGLGLASLIGRTETFFRFGDADGVSIGPTWSIVGPAATAFVLLVAVQLIPLAAMAARISPGGRTSVDSQQPWFQRSRIDLVAVLVVVVITWRGVSSDGGRSELLDDPAIVLLPSAAAVAAGLIVLRTVPIVMRGVAAVLARTNRSASLVAARRAARVPADLAAPLLLLVVTTTLATFTASLATTLDLQLADESLHRTGGVARITDEGRPVPATIITPSSDAALPNPARTVVRHADLDAYARVWGVTAASASIELVGSGRHADGDLRGFRFRGIDPTTFAQVSFWRDDFADRSLVDLMAALASRPDAVLVDRSLLSAEGIATGETLELELVTASGGLRSSFDVVGSFEQFPGWYPDAEPALIVGRADVVETLTGATHDRRVVIEVDERFGDRNRVENDLAMFGASPSSVGAAVVAIDAGRADPGRQGVLGLLTVGVAVAASLTLIGFVVSTVGSLRRRTTELGVLRAMGMTRREVTTMALFDLGSVMALGLLASLALGVAFSRWFIPVLVDTTPGAAPELLPTVAWSAIVVLAIALLALLIVAAALVVLALRRVRLYEAIRLGEAGR